MAGRARPRKRKKDFAFTGLITCSGCGGSVTADEKKGGRYIYYHCAAKCEAVKYIPEAKVSEQLGEAIRSIVMPAEVVDVVRRVLLESQQDQLQFHRDATQRLSQRKAKIGSYLDQAYTDRLEGVLALDEYSRRSTTWRDELVGVEREIERHDEAKRTYVDEGVQLIELAQVAHILYVSQPPHEQRRLLDVVVSNCVLEGTSVRYYLRKPWDILAEMEKEKKWRGGRDSNPRPPA